MLGNTNFAAADAHCIAIANAPFRLMNSNWLLSSMNSTETTCDCTTPCYTLAELVCVNFACAPVSCKQQQVTKHALEQFGMLGVLTCNACHSSSAVAGQQKPAMVLHAVHISVNFER